MDCQQQYSRALRWGLRVRGRWGRAGDGGAAVLEPFAGVVAGVVGAIVDMVRS